MLGTGAKSPLGQPGGDWGCLEVFLAVPVCLAEETFTPKLADLQVGQCSVGRLVSAPHGIRGSSSTGDGDLLPRRIWGSTPCRGPPRLHGLREILPIRAAKNFKRLG